LAIFALTLAMVETPFQTEALFIAAVCLAALQAAGFFTTSGAAILLTSITTAAEIKHCAAGGKVAETLAKEFGTGRWHRFG